MKSNNNNNNDDDDDDDDDDDNNNNTAMGSVYARGDTFLTFSLKALTETNTSRLTTDAHTSSPYFMQIFLDNLYLRYIFIHKCKLIFTFQHWAIETRCVLKCPLCKQDSTIRFDVRMRKPNIT
jgi:hypothetical protein